MTGLVDRGESAPREEAEWSGEGASERELVNDTKGKLVPLSSAADVGWVKGAKK